MSNPELDPSESKEHAAAMAVCAMIDGLTNLVKMAHEGDGINIVRDEIRDLDLIQRDLTILLALLKQAPRLQVVR